LPVRLAKDLSLFLFFKFIISGKRDFYHFISYTCTYDQANSKENPGCYKLDRSHDNFVHHLDLLRY
jgi:hypothetical protein